MTEIRDGPDRWLIRAQVTEIETDEVVWEDEGLVIGRQTLAQELSALLVLAHCIWRIFESGRAITVN